MSREGWILIGALVLLVLLYILMLRHRPFSAGRIVYQDLVRDSIPAKTLYSRQYGLSGKPDMIVQKGGKYIPVEIKSAEAPESPYPHHTAQLMAYCLLTEESTGICPPYGILLYKNKSFTLRWTPKERKKLISTLEKMRSCKETGYSHEPKCKGCGYRDVCS